MEKKDAAGTARDICVIYSIAPPVESAGLARSLINKNLAACVNITPVRSLYRWKGEFCDDEEHLLIIKTRRELAEAVIDAIKEEHPYEVPEIIALPVIAGSVPYLEWVYGETKGS
nr:divalent-cation tolerance protein CutA [uncultured Methanoregula sp.]